MALLGAGDVVEKALAHRPGLKVQEGQQWFLAVAVSAIVMIAVP